MLHMHEWLCRKIHNGTSHDFSIHVFSGGILAVILPGSVKALDVHLHTAWYVHYFIKDDQLMKDLRMPVVEGRHEYHGSWQALVNELAGAVGNHTHFLYREFVHLATLDKLGLDKTDSVQAFINQLEISQSGDRPCS